MSYTKFLPTKKNLPLFLICHYVIFKCRYGISQLESPQRKPVMASTFTDLQERAKQFFNVASNDTAENVPQMLQLIEDFCRAGDKLIDEEKQIKKDLQEQVSKFFGLDEFVLLYKLQRNLMCRTV